MNSQEEGLYEEEIIELEKERYVSREALPVVITSYEVTMMDKKYLNQLGWKYIIVDEGHRLKNLECKYVYFFFYFFFFISF